MMKVKSHIIYILLILILTSCGTTHQLSTQAKEENETEIVLANVTQEHISSFKLYYDDGPYVSGPIIPIDTICVVYSFEMTSYQSGVEIKDTFTYYLPLGQSSVIFRGNKFSGKGYHGGHLIILKEENDQRYDDIPRKYFNGGTLVRPKSGDPNALLFEKYCQQQGYIKK